MKPWQICFIATLPARFLNLVLIQMMHPIAALFTIHCTVAKHVFEFFLRLINVCDSLLVQSKVVPDVHSISLVAWER